MRTKYGIAVLILTLSVLFGACSKNKRQTSYAFVNDSTGITITVDIPNYPALPYDSVIDEISFVRLETRDDCLIGNVSQLLCTDSLIFIVDHVTKKILTFDYSGKFLYPISQVGQGPGEIYGSRLCNISLSPTGDELVVFDFGKICYFTLDGKFLREEIVTWDCEELRIMPNGMLCSFTTFGNAQEEGRPMLSVFEKTDKLHYATFPTYYTDNRLTFGPRSALKKFGDKVYYCYPFSSTFYEVTPEGVNKAFAIDLQGTTKVEITEGIDDNLLYELMKKGIYCEDFIILKDKAVFELQLYRADISPFIIYSMKSQKTYCCDVRHTRNPLFVFRLEPQARYGDNTLVVSRNSGDVMRRKEWLKGLEGMDMQVHAKLYDGYTEDCNPVLFFFHVKEDL